MTDKEHTNGNPVSWWNRVGLITAVTAIAAAIAPITTGVKGFFELQVEQEKNRFEMRDKYLSRAIDKNLGSEDRERLFEFLVAVFKDDPLQRWAQAQLDDATAQLKEKLKEAEDAKRQLQGTLVMERELSETLSLNMTKLQEEKEKLQNELAVCRAI